MVFLVPTLSLYMACMILMLSLQGLLGLYVAFKRSAWSSCCSYMFFLVPTLSLHGLQVPTLSLHGLPGSQVVPAWFALSPRCLSMVCLVPTWLALFKWASLHGLPGPLVVHTWFA